MFEKIHYPQNFAAELTMKNKGLFGAILLGTVTITLAFCFFFLRETVRKDQSHVEPGPEVIAFDKKPSEPKKPEDAAPIFEDRTDGSTGENAVSDKGPLLAPLTPTLPAPVSGRGGLRSHLRIDKNADATSDEIALTKISDHDDVRGGVRDRENEREKEKDNEPVGDGDNPEGRGNWFMYQRLYPFKEIPEGARQRAR